MNPRGWQIKITQNPSMGTYFCDVIKMAAPMISGTKQVIQ